jgi:tetratricopeptide (TPR) repeat protein
MGNSDSPKKMEKRGKSAFQRGDYQAAAQDFKAARQAYEEAGDAVTAAEMANNCSVAYLQADEPEKALQAAEGTADIFADAGDQAKQGMAVGNCAAALEELGQTDEAIEAYLLSAELLEGSGEDQLRANVMQALSQLQFQEGRRLEALASMQSGIDGVEKPSPKQRFLKRLLNIPFEMMNNNKS